MIEPENDKMFNLRELGGKRMQKFPIQILHKNEYSTKIQRS